MTRLLDLIWPRACEVCGRPADRPGRHLCSACLMRIPFLPVDGCCSVCGTPVEGLTGEYLCEDCRGRNRPFFDRAMSAVRFEDRARDMLLAYKFRSRLWLRDDFTDWLVAAARARFDVSAVDAVLPLPITRFHRLDRGYDQSLCLARAVAREFGRICLTDALGRIGHPKRQSTLSEDERRANVRDTFIVRRPDAVRGRTVLVIDDVLTTGATLSECARTLKAAGAARVWCLTLARAVRG